MKQIIGFLILLAVIVLAISDFMDMFREDKKKNDGNNKESLNNMASLDDEDEQVISLDELKKAEAEQGKRKVEVKKTKNSGKSSSNKSAKKKNTTKKIQKKK